MIGNDIICEKMAEVCFRLFIENGLRSVSIEDISQACNISKKELYDTFGNKEGVIREALQYDLYVTNQLFETTSRLAENAIEETILVHKQFMNMLSNLSPVLFFDLSKYYTEIGLQHMNGKIELSEQFILKNLDRGIEEGVYRSDIDREIVSRLWISKMELIKEQKWFPLHEFDIQRLIYQFVELHLHSIASEKGLTIINQKLSNTIK